MTNRPSFQAHLVSEIYEICLSVGAHPTIVPGTHSAGGLPPGAKTSWINPSRTNFHGSIAVWLSLMTAMAAGNSVVTLMRRGRSTTS